MEQVEESCAGEEESGARCGGKPIGGERDIDGVQPPFDGFDARAEADGAEDEGDVGGLTSEGWDGDGGCLGVASFGEEDVNLGRDDGWGVGRESAGATNGGVGIFEAGLEFSGDGEQLEQRDTFRIDAEAPFEFVGGFVVPSARKECPGEGADDPGILAVAAEEGAIGIDGLRVSARGVE